MPELYARRLDASDRLRQRWRSGHHVVLGNAGRTIYSGFLFDDLVGHEIIANEVGYVLGGIPTVPAPGAILLGSLGAGLVGWFRRRRTL